MGLARLRTVFVQVSRTEGHLQWRLVADQLREKYPEIATIVDGSEDESAGPYGVSQGLAAATAQHQGA